MQKHLQKWLLIATMLLVPWVTQGQTLGEYIYSTGIDTTKWVNMGSATQILSPSGSDGLASSLRNIGFAFPFGEDVYTQYSVNTDGNLRFGSTVTGTANYATPFSSSNANVNNPKINFFGCDGYGLSGSHYVRALTTVDSDSVAMLVVEFCMGTYTSATRNELYKWQMHLYQNGNIEVVYGSSPTTAPAATHQPGLCVNASDGWIINSSNVAIHFTSGSSSIISSGSWHEHGRYYRFEAPIITCPRPLTLNSSHLSPNSFDITWLNADNSDAYASLVRLYHGDTLLYDAVEYGDSVSFTGLIPNTIYTAGVASLCSAGDTSTFRTIDVHTPCVYMDSLPFFYDFESAPTGSQTTGSAFPECWTRLNNGSSYGGYPYASSSTTYNHTPGGGKGLYWYNTTTTGTYGDYQCVVLPGVDTNIYPIRNLQIRFWAKSSSSSYYPVLYVGVMSDPSDISTFQYVDTINVGNSTIWNEYETYFSHFSGEGSHVAIRANRPTSSWYVYVDDITLEEIPACPRTSELVQTDASLTSVTVSWTEMGSASQWILEYHTVDFVPGTNAGTVEVVTSLPYTITGLDSAHSYYIYVHADCGDDTSQNRFLLARTMAASPTTTPYFCDFEAEGPNGWELLNGNQTNIWVVDSAVNHGGSKSLYISNNGGTSNAYTTSTISYAYAYRTISFPDSGHYAFSYDWRSVGESHNYDFTRVFLSPVGYQWEENNNPAGSTYSFASWSCPAGWIELTEPFGSPANLAQSSAWRTYVGSFHIDSASTYNLVFAWANDGSGGSQPPTAIDNVAIVPNTCPAPEVHADYITPDTIILTWTPGGSETSWILSTDSIEMEVFDTFYVFDNLSANTEYRFVVRGICSSDDTSMMASLIVRTACGPMSVPFREGFDSYLWSTSTSDPLAPCWQKHTSYTTSYPYASTSYNHTPGGSKSMYMYSTSSTWTIMVLPAFAPSLDSLQLSFWLYRSNTSYVHRLEIGVMSNPSDPATFVSFDTVVPTMSSTWEEFMVPLRSDSLGGGYIAIRSPNGEYSYPYLDDIKVDYLPTCTRPTGISLLMSSIDTVRVAWTDTTHSTSFQLVCGAFGFDPDTATTGIIDIFDSTRVYDFLGLSPTLTYDIYVRIDCGADGTSSWVGPVSVRPGSINMPVTGHDTITACNVTIFDDGGPMGTYSHNANSTMVFYAPHPDSLFAFSGFAYTESTLDQLTSYDGVGTSPTPFPTVAPSLLLGIPMVR